MAGLSVPLIGMGPTWTRPTSRSPLDVDPYDANARASRMSSFENYMATNPGARPGGTGATGLQPNDAAGWSRLLEQQQQYAKDVAASSGRAAPTARFAGYSGFTGERERSAMPTAAMQGLKTAIGTPAGERSSGRLPQIIADDPTLYSAYKNSLLDEFQGRGRESRRLGMSPIDQYGEKAEARLRFDPMLSALDRDEEYAGIMNRADATSDAFFTHGEPVMRAQYGMYGDLAREKGAAATLDDEIRARSAQMVAEINANSRLSAAEKQAQIQALSALGREIGNARTYGDTSRVQGLTPQFDTGVSGAMQGGTPGAGASTPPAGAPAAGAKVLTRDQLMQTAQANGWDEATALAQARQWGYTVQ